MSDLSLLGSPASARGHFELLQTRGVASFRFDRGISDLLFWHVPLHIEGIDVEALMRMQDHTKAQLIQIDPAYFKVAPALPSPTSEPPIPQVPKLFIANKKVIAMIAGIAAFLASLTIILTFIQSQPW
jgi:hypothetical protein